MIYKAPYNLKIEIGDMIKGATFRDDAMSYD